MIVFENSFIFLDYDEEQSLVMFVYKPETTAHMTDEQFQENMRQYADIVEQNKPTRLIVDNRELRYTIIPEMQDWVSQEIAPRTTALKKLAFIVSKDLFAQVSMEQMMEEKAVSEVYNVRYFDSFDEAKIWVFAKD
ncbi:STAS/SEC14 domain-containing protein [Eisenibacter elegans]|jgi:hypothetical protein|uniref:STAS/SEC14 domain-containing protein n=1 Tax=Eisenibacter elegans TaxID=997 RepID=UPI0004199EC3|nr:STAS/SEC14 domain-containing protein [Eisenibacter elegans]